MKRLIPCIYLYKEKAVKNFKDITVVSDNPVELAKTYSENAADELIVFDMSKGDEEHEKALDVMKEISNAIEIPVIGAGENISFFYETGDAEHPQAAYRCLHFRDDLDRPVRQCERDDAVFKRSHDHCDGCLFAGGHVLDLPESGGGRHLRQRYQ